MNEFEVVSVFRSPCEQSPIFSTDVLDGVLQESRQIFVEHARGLRVKLARGSLYLSMHARNGVTDRTRQRKQRFGLQILFFKERLNSFGKTCQAPLEVL